MSELETDDEKEVEGLFLIWVRGVILGVRARRPGEGVAGETDGRQTGCVPHKQAVQGRKTEVQR